MVEVDRARSADFSSAVRALVAARCGGCCERCGRAGMVQLHHRLYRSRGGTGDAFNALALCGFGNVDGCHGVAHTGEGELLGLSVGVGFDPREVPVMTVRFGFVFLGDEGHVLRGEERSCWVHAGRADVGCTKCRLSGDLLWSFDLDRGNAFDRGVSREY